MDQTASQVLEPASHRLIRYGVATLALWALIVSGPIYLSALANVSVQPGLAVLAFAIAVSALLGAYGLWRGKVAGFFAFALFTGLITLLLGQSLVPYVLQLAPAELRAVGVVSINGLVVACLAGVFWRREKAKQGEKAAASTPA